ncbi:MAG: PhzF family phenazine biosynthesis protein [Gammaproteobacteria bacterium]|tara:strand:- start:954 stop:1730 length:777 start_codon:yes stop_codon:yes gene_type:complete
MKFDVYFVDAFTSESFSGNPAAVIFSDVSDEVLMQNIAAENNLSETAFINLSNNGIRWFSPTCEVNLCGHATLASAFIYFNYLDNSKESIVLNSASGELKVYKKNKYLQLDFPKDKFERVDMVKKVEIATGVKPIETYIGDINLFAVYENEEVISNIQPDFDAVSKLDGQGLIISSSSNQYDFVSRYFCPKFGINEDPVTGSAHTTLIPYWSEKLSKDSLTAKQISKRGGELFCQNKNDRVLIGGNAVLYMKGTIEIS